MSNGYLPAMLELLDTVLEYFTVNAFQRQGFVNLAPLLCRTYCAQNYASIVGCMVSSYSMRTYTNTPSYITLQHCEQTFRHLQTILKHIVSCKGGSPPFYTTWLFCMDFTFFLIYHPKVNHKMVCFHTNYCSYLQMQ